ncbi:MAG: hypothetical protein IPG12_14265 [Saprospiraceae bacterium]|nr:hypothetical protein [Saprospiraceae bacterium]
MEKILRIEETTFKKTKDDWQSFDGFQIITDLQTIKIGISNDRSCCESFGCIITNDETKEFIGAELKSLAIVDTALKNNKKIKELEYLYCGGAMFVNLETSEGLLQFVAYNAHNGYYGHEAVLLSKQLNHEEQL